MAKKRFLSEQIVAILREAEKAPSVEEVLRKHGISEQTYYRWKVSVRLRHVGKRYPKVWRLRLARTSNPKNTIMFGPGFFFYQTLFLSPVFRAVESFFLKFPLDNWRSKIIN